MDPDLPEIDRAAGATGQEYAYGRLRYALITGALPPGASLTLRGVAAAFGLSPTPVREAVRRLHSENAIEVLETRRLRVPDMGAGRFEELVALRVALEGHAATRSLPHVSDRLADRMAALDAGMAAAAAAGELDRLTALNHAFHRALVEVNPDQAAMPMIESVWLQLGPFQRRAVAAAGDPGSFDRHADILAALRARDADALRAAIAADVGEGARIARPFLRPPGGAAPACGLVGTGGMGGTAGGEAG